MLLLTVSDNNKIDGRAELIELKSFVGSDVRLASNCFSLMFFGELQNVSHIFLNAARAC